MRAITRNTTKAAPCCSVSPLPSLGGERRSYSGFVQPFVAHSHDHYVIGRVRQGERELMLNGKTLRIYPGDLIVFNPGDVHGCTHSSDELFAYDSVTIATDKLDGAVLAPLQDGEDAAAEAFETLMEAIRSEDDEAILERALYLASLLESNEVVQHLPTQNEDVTLRAYAHMLGHLAKPASIKELAQGENISEYALIRAYRRRFSITPLQHLTSLRIECACKLLAQGASPADVAEETGFADQAHLTRMFKQRLGTTPVAYRKMTARRNQV
ncbi:AraC family transcriptional regulator [Eggerthellaceae bacterium 3-80]|nr:AraC family transcriptional regulator [bacterium D16-34]